MSGLSSSCPPASACALGKGRQWDGIPLPVEHQSRFWPIGSHHASTPRARVLFDITFERGAWMALTDLPCRCEITEGDARELIQLIRANGHEAKSVTFLRREARREWQAVASWYPAGYEPRPLTSRPLRVRKMCSAGAEERLIRRLTRGDRARTVRRQQARQDRHTTGPSRDE